MKRTIEILPLYEVMCVQLCVYTLSSSNSIKNYPVPSPTPLLHLTGFLLFHTLIINSPVYPGKNRAGDVMPDREDRPRNCRHGHLRKST